MTTTRVTMDNDDSSFLLSESKTTRAQSDDHQPQAALEAEIEALLQPISAVSDDSSSSSIFCQELERLRSDLLACENDGTNESSGPNHQSSHDGSKRPLHTFLEQTRNVSPPAVVIGLATTLLLNNGSSNTNASSLNTKPNDEDDNPGIKESMSSTAVDIALRKTVLATPCLLGKMMKSSSTSGTSTKTVKATTSPTAAACWDALYSACVEALQALASSSSQSTTSSTLQLLTTTEVNTTEVNTTNGSKSATKTDLKPFSTMALSNTLAVLNQLLLLKKEQQEQSTAATNTPEGEKDDTPNYLKTLRQQGLASTLFGGQEVTIDITKHVHLRHQEMIAWCQQVLRLPRKVANAAAAISSRNRSTNNQLMPLRWQPGRFETALVVSTTREALQQAEKMVEDTENASLTTWCCLLRELLLMQGADMVAVAILRLEEMENEQAWNSLLTRLCRHLASSRLVANLVQALFLLLLSRRDNKKNQKKGNHRATENQRIRTTLLTLLQSSKDVQDNVVRLLVLNNSTPPERRESIASAKELTQLLSDLPNQDINGRDSEDDDSDDDDDDTEYRPNSPLMRQLLKVARVWSSSIFFRRTDPRVQAHVGTFFVQGIDLLQNGRTKHDSNALDPVRDGVLVGCLLEGTSHRLESTLSVLRLDGMRVAQALANSLGQELNFDELKEEALEQQPDETSTKEETALLQENSKLTGNEKAEPTENDDDDSLWDDDSVLVPYDLEDDQEDIRETPRPLYLRQCLELLRTGESEDSAYSRHETGLRELPSLIKSRPLDLPDIAMDLMIEVLHMENKFDMNQFAEMKMACLSSLVVAEPQHVGSGLIVEAFGSCSLMTRLQVLGTLCEGAYELSGQKQLEETKREAIEDGASKVHGKRRIVAAAATAKEGSNNQTNQAIEISVNSDVRTALEDRTRRWGRGRKTANSRAIVNNFSNLAPVWFYGLLGNFVERRDDPTLWGGAVGATFLAQLLLAMSNILEFAGVSATGVDVMAKDLFRLVWGFRHAEVAEVRIASLCGVASSLACLRDCNSLWSLAQEEGAESLQQGLLEIASSDSDNKCRKLAASISSQVQTSLRSEGSGLLAVG